MASPVKKRFRLLHTIGQGAWRSALAVVGLGGGLFVFVLKVIRPEAVHLAQLPVFFSGRRFFLERLSLPGGFIDYLAAYLTDGFQNGWFGALVLSFLWVLTVWVLIRLLEPRWWWITVVLPVALLVLLHTRPDYPLAGTLSFLLGLLALALYRRLTHLGPWRLAVGALLLLLLAFLSPFALLLTAACCAVFEGFQTRGSLARRFLIAAGFLGFAALLPLVTASTVYLVPLRMAYFKHAPFLTPRGIRPIGLFLPLIMVILVAASEAGLYHIKPKGRIPWIVQVVGMALILLCIPLDLLRYRVERGALFIRQAAHERRWETVLKRVNDQTIRHPMGAFHIHRALFHLGRMGSDFFTLPQHFGFAGLFLSKEVAFQFPLDRSDFFFEIGHLNEAKRWAFEALTLYGEATPVLKRLALIHLIQDEIPAAVAFLQRLRQNPYSRRWADHYLACLADPARMRAETELQRLHAVMPKRDFIVMTTNPALDLVRMLEQFPQNRMAVEYLLISHLLERDLDSFTRLILRYRPLIKGPLPRHFEEALIAYLSLKKEAALPEAREVEFRRSTLDKFQHLERVIKQYQNDLRAAYPSLKAAFSDTYWFYLLYPERAFEG